MTHVGERYVKDNFDKIMDEIIKTNNPAFVRGDKGNVVILSEADFKVLSEAFTFYTNYRNKRDLLNNINSALDD